MGEIKFVYDVIICYNRCIAISMLDCAADGTLCGESNEAIGVCGEPHMTPHSFFSDIVSGDSLQLLSQVAPHSGSRSATQSMPSNGAASPGQIYLYQCLYLHQVKLTHELEILCILFLFLILVHEHISFLCHMCRFS